MYEHFQIDDIVYFQLKGRAAVDQTLTMVSASKWPTVSTYDWYLGSSGYPICYQLSKMPLHRFIFRLILQQRPPSNIYVDHIDRNKLNNTDANLRLATPQENSFNKSTKTNTKGVTRIADDNYQAVVVKSGKRHVISGMPSAEAAADMYNMMAEELFGTYAAKNQPCATSLS